MKKYLTQIIFAVLLTFLFGKNDLYSQNEPFSVRGWDIGRYEPENIKQWIDEAHDAGMNTITFSADIIMDWWQLYVKDPDDSNAPNPEELASNLEEWCAYAASKGMESYLWNHAIELGEDIGLTPPDSVLYRQNGLLYLDFDRTELWEWLDSTYQNVMNKVPSMSGIVLSLTEARWQIHRGPHEPYYEKKDRKIASALSPELRMAKVLNVMRDALAKRNKKLIVRGFLRTPMEHEFLAAALDSVPLDVGVYSKHVPNDFRYNYAPNPLLGRFPNRVQLVEVEPARIGAADYYKSLYQSIRDLGMSGIIPRIRVNINTFRDFNNYCYNTLIHDPDADINPLWDEYFLSYYGNPIAFDTAKSVLNRTFSIFMKSNYPCGFYLGYNKRIPEIDKSDYRIDTRDAALWTDDPKVQQIYEMLKTGDPQIIDSAVAQERIAELEANNCLASLEAVQQYFDSEKYNELVGVFEEFRVFARSMQVWAPAYLHYRNWRDNKSDSISYTNVKIALQNVLDFLSKERYTTGLRDFAYELVDAISYQWESNPQGWNSFEGNSLPENSIPPWTEMDKTSGITENGISDLFSVIDDPDISGNKILKIEELIGDRKESFGFEWGITDPNLGVTAVFRAKPSDGILGAQNGDGNNYRYIYLSLRNGKYREQLLIEYPGKIIMGQSNLETELESYDQWHIYRFTLKNDFFTVYVDESPIPIISGFTPKSDNDNFFKWGDTSTGGLCGNLLDWLIWDLSGAYSPGEGTPLPAILTGLENITSVKDECTDLPPNFELLQNYPNPFNPSTTIEFYMPFSSSISIRIFDINGSMINELIDNYLLAGKHSVNWDGRNLFGNSVASGVYLCVLNSQSVSLQKRMLILK